MNIVIPIGGIGQRFQDENYIRPKPLINVLGKSMISWVLESLNTHEDDIIIIIYNTELDKYGFVTQLQNKYGNTMRIEFIPINYQTRGAAETIWYGLSQLDDLHKNRPLISIDCDTFYQYDILAWYREKADINAVLCFEEPDKKPIYSYSQMNADGKIMDIKEKIPISKYANTGCYIFKNACIFLYYFNKVNESVLSDELYVSIVIEHMIHSGENVYGHIISDFYCLGTPLQVKLFSVNHYHLNKHKYRFCFDLDNTLVLCLHGDYSNPIPNVEYINMCKLLKKMGHTIIIYTARRMRTHQGNSGKVVADIAQVTIDTLNKLDIPYDELYFGKPYAHYYIDDLAVSTFENIEKALGIYQTTIKERKFNELCASSIETIVKKSTSKKIKGEIFWYKNIPDSISHMFPLLIRHSDQQYEIEKIDGIPIAYLYVNNSLDINTFIQVLDHIDLIHKTYSNVSLLDLYLDRQNIYLNYVTKLQDRYHSYSYNAFKHHDIVYNFLLDELTKYEQTDQGEIAVIHGDPVFSNIILSRTRDIKFIDMRGMLGNEVTIYGDKLYDYAKIFQSIIGYEHISSDRFPKSDIISTYTQLLKSRLSETQFKWVRIITASLLFTLIPLHDDNKCQSYYNLIFRKDVIGEYINI